MKYTPDIIVTVQTTDGKLKTDVSISQYIIDNCCGDSYLLEHYEMDFKELADDWSEMWTEHSDENPAIDKMLEYMWAEEDKGNKIDTTFELKSTTEEIMEFVKKYKPKYYAWMLQWIQRENVDYNAK